MKIGVIIDSFRCDFKTSIEKAKAVGADGVQIGAKFLIGKDDPLTERFNIGDVSVSVPEAKKILDANGIKVSAICGDFGCDMYYTKDRELIDAEKTLLDMALELGTNIVTTHIGVVPETENCIQYESMHEVCYELAEYAKSINGHFAVETGPEMSERLKGFLDNLGSNGVAVNLDPANLIMCAGDDPVRAVYNLRDYIVHTHAKDGVQYKQIDTKAFYSPRYYGLAKVSGRGVYYSEVPLGEGSVKWNEYLNALKEIGYDSYLTIEREVGETPEADIGKAVKFLDSLKVRG